MTVEIGGDAWARGQQGRRDQDGGGEEESVELRTKRWEERDKKRDGYKVAIKEVFVPVGAVCSISQLGIEAHDCGEELSDSQD